MERREKGKGAALQELGDEQEHELFSATEGTGPLLQRDYVGVIEGSRLSPEEVLQLLVSDFPRFSPRLLASFTQPEEGQPLQVGDVMGIWIQGAGPCEVEVTRIDHNSFTMHTLKGHPEAGRITFGAHLDSEGRLVFRIRSRTRTQTATQLVGYAVFGMFLQTKVWTTFVARVAEACGGKLIGDVDVQTQQVEDSLADKGEIIAPTFVEP